MRDRRREVRSPAARKLGAEIRRRREAKGLALRALAELLELDPGSLSLLERGQQEPRYDHLRAIAGALGTRVSVLVASAESDPSHPRKVARSAA